MQRREFPFCNDTFWTLSRLCICTTFSLTSRAENSVCLIIYGVQIAGKTGCTLAYNVNSILSPTRFSKFWNFKFCDFWVVYFNISHIWKSLQTKCSTITNVSKVKIRISPSSYRGLKSTVVNGTLHATNGQLPDIMLTVPLKWCDLNCSFV